MNNDISKVVEEVLRIYPNAEEVDVSFYHDENGRGPFIDKFNIKLEDGKILSDYRITDEIEDELDNLRRSGYGYYFTLDVINKEIL